MRHEPRCDAKLLRPREQQAVTDVSISTVGNVTGTQRRQLCENSGTVTAYNVISRCCRGAFTTCIRVLGIDSVSYLAALGDDVAAIVDGLVLEDIL